jgi:ATP-dependent exoDNAse (exonuclease V) alpha subunit
MTAGSSARPLPGVVKSRINRIAHAAALRHEAEVREMALQALAALAANGAGIAELNAHLDQLDPTSRQLSPLNL